MDESEPIAVGGQGDWARRSGAVLVRPVAVRKLAKVPFVELADGRVQGVVSSGSDIARVYVSAVTAVGHGLSCSTNNNRPCGALHGPQPCKHIRLLLAEAALQYGTERVARYLRVEVEPDGDLPSALDAHHEPTPAATVFSRFLRHLSYLELPEVREPVPELHWFGATRVVG
ncbi:hypothetical protein Athai_40700 [Actinocatenispora thailandica]|uniref:SWIM-type domain-containing protein n=1 Tax=Actinocatenispora thailandica TaxID=227318 RepID=A0A7R7DRQ3_9ACTN|nr:hypothetical protein [Actinocatenispora thailandica]BCJ36567.1 hypothetical protein Athai_40700 [Actinocatenispora thailandica]